MGYGTSISMDDHQKWGLSPIFRPKPPNRNFHCSEQPPEILASRKTWGPRRKGRRRFRNRSFQRRSVTVSRWAGSKKMVLKCAEDFLDLPDVIYIYIYNYNYIHTYTAWWFGTWMDYDFPETVGNVIIPTDELIFFRGVGIPPTSIYIYIHLSVCVYVSDIHGW